MISFSDRLSAILTAQKLLTRDQLGQALKWQVDIGGNLSDIIVALKFAGHKQLAAVLSKDLGVTLFDLKHFEIDPGIVKIIPLNIARRYQIIPTSKSADSLSLAMADPLNIFAIENLPEFRGFKINPVISPFHDIQQAIELYYPAVFKANINDLLEESISPVEIIKPEKNLFSSSPDIDYSGREAPVVKAVNLILEEMVKTNASEALIEISDKRLRIRFRISGLLKEQELSLNGPDASIIARLKSMSGLEITKHDVYQQKRFKTGILGRQVDFNITVLPVAFGERVVLRLPDKIQVVPDIKDLGFADYAAGILSQVSRFSSGLFLVCGPGGTGKTTTLYALLKSLSSPDKNIVTIENPVEARLGGINQVAAEPDIGFTFAAGIRSILLQDPNIIMVGEIGDYDTVDMAVKSALTGHLVLSSLDTDTATSAVFKLIDMGVAPYLINSSLIGIIAQRLLRKLCPHCKEAYVLNKKVTEDLKINLHDIVEPKFYKAKGCPHCFNTGYSGKVAIAEVLQFSQKMRELISALASEQAFRQAACLGGMQTLRQAGFDAALKGQTTIEEVLRLTEPEV
ncbi:MAG: ATPase, T2SS/T4P/T4SS family [Candidatus Omnitrophica bacterium]|nr:ATPase, T2SS/T4P/T4SS family [Candidatus Omnitrophota bacterium]